MKNSLEIIKNLVEPHLEFQSIVTKWSLVVNSISDLNLTFDSLTPNQKNNLNQIILGLSLMLGLIIKDLNNLLLDENFCVDVDADKLKLEIESLKKLLDKLKSIRF